jgi:hypothetical protein
VWVDHSISWWAHREVLVFDASRDLGLAALACSRAALREAVPPRSCPRLAGARASSYQSGTSLAGRRLAANV